MVWNGLVGLTGLFVGASLAVAAPPINPQIEGREPNPVVREFYETEKPIQEYGTGPVLPERSRLNHREADWPAIVTELWEMFLLRLTIPLDLP